MTDRKFVPKGWGYEDWIVNKEEYCGKLLFFKKGKRCSWHYHDIKDETFYIQEGELEVRYGWTNDKSNLNTEVVILKAGDAFHVPVGMRHQMTGLTDVKMFEFSTQHFDEDSIRIEVGSQ
jgi:mannose-6-phosphate isomerase-like protein (cupin superfamily)|tara:strand:+ start:4616 stop:4975 length:360 start_codon:yes stop_codon:yes gene_type:complete